MFWFGLAKFEIKKARQTNPHKEVKCQESAKLKGLQSPTQNTHTKIVSKIASYTHGCVKGYAHFAIQLTHRSKRAKEKMTDKTLKKSGGLKPMNEI